MPEHAVALLTTNHSNNLRAESKYTYVVGFKSFRPDKLFKVTEIKQLCYFPT